MTSNLYDPQRCTVQLQERGELEWACTAVARKAFRLVLVVPGGVVLSLAGVAIVGGIEVAWPQVSDCPCCASGEHAPSCFDPKTSRRALLLPCVVGVRSVYITSAMICRDGACTHLNNLVCQSREHIPLEPFFNLLVIHVPQTFLN